MTEEHDPVVQEVDVFLNKQLMDTLYLLQYPVRPAHRLYDDVEHLSARMKPKQQKVELELSINSNCPNYSKSKGEQIALNVQGSVESSQDQFYSSGIMDKQLISSQSVAVDSTRYAIGFLKDNELHLNPLKGIIQMRSSFNYLDKVDNRMKCEQEAESSQDEDEEAKPVTVKFSRHETEEAKVKRMASYEYMKKIQEEEKWINMRHHSREEPMAEAERSLLIAQQSNDGNEFYLSPADYLKKLIPKTEEHKAEKPALPNNVLSMADLKTMNFNDQIKALLINAKVIRFSQLIALLPKGSDMTSMLRCLQQVALMVQGSFVVKSEILYPEDSFSAFSGVPAEMLCRGRDYIMWRFTQSRYLVRKDISSVIKLHAEDVKDMLEQMACLKVNKGWEFLMECDTEFMHRHPDVVQRQQMIWKAKFDSLSEVLKVSPTDMKLAAASVTSMKRRRTSSRSRTKSGGLSDLSDSDLPGDSMKAGERRRHSSSTDRKKSVLAVDDIQEAVANGASSVAFEPKQQTDVKETVADAKKELLKFTREKLTSRTVMKLSDLRTSLNFRLSELPSGHTLGKGVSDSMLISGVRGAGGVEIPRAVSKLSEPLFVNSICGDRFDVIRAVIVDMLQSNIRVIVKAVKVMVEERQDGVLMSEADVRKVVKEYCVSKGGTWMLKGIGS